MIAIELPVINADGSVTNIFLAPDSEAMMTVITEETLLRIDNAATATGGNIPLQFGGETIDCPTYELVWRTPDGSGKTLLLAAAPLPAGIDGILGRDSFEDVGVRLIDTARPPSAATAKHYAVTAADARRRGDCAALQRLLATYRDPDTVHALATAVDAAERYNAFNKALHEFEKLLTTTAPSRDQLQRLLDEVPEPHEQDTFELHAVLDQLITNKAARDTNSEDPLFNSFCKKLASYAALSEVTPAGARLRAALTDSVRKRAPLLVTPSNYMDLTPAATAAEHGIVHHVDFIEGAVVPPQRRQRMPPLIDRAFRQWHADSMVSNGLIREATPDEIHFGRTTGAVYPHLAVADKHATFPVDANSYRFPLDASGLKKCERLRPHTDMPTYKDVSDFARGKTYFTVVDLKRYYFQIALDEDSQKHTLHEVAGRYYVYRVCPPGLRNAANTAMRLIRHVLREHIAAGVAMPWMDDICVATHGAETEHQAAVEAVLDDLARHNLRINLSKLVLAKPYARFLGYILTSDGAAIDLLRYSPIIRWPVPTGRPALRLFSGFAQYFSKFVPRMGELLIPIDAIVNEPVGTKFKFQGAARRNFDTIRAAIIEASTLIHADYGKPFHVFTDTSVDAVGSVLAQEHEGHMRPLAFSTKRLNPAQRRYAATTLELFGMHHSVTKMWHEWVVASPIHLWTDHKNAATALDPLATTDRRRGRWLAELHEYDIREVHYIPAADMRAPDALSRIQWDANGTVHLQDAVDVVLNYAAESYKQPARVMHEYTNGSASAAPVGPPFVLPTRSGRGYGPRPGQTQTASATPPAQQGASQSAAAPQTAGATRPASGGESPLIVTTGDIRREQQTDPFCAKLTKYIGHDGSGVPKDDVDVYHHAARCAVVDGIIWYNDYIRWADVNQRVVVLPASMQERVIERAHASPIGHSAVHATFLSLRRHFWWPAMYASVDQYVARCSVCVRARTRNAPKHGTFSTTQATFPAQEAAIDLIELGDQHSDYPYALVCVYSFSKYIWVRPLRSKRADEVAQALLHIFIDHHVPHRLRSDLGNEFGGAVARLCDKLGVRRVLTAPATKSSSGEIERANREVQNVIRRLKDDYPTTSWETFIPAAHEHVRAAIHSSTGFSPRELEGFRSPVHSAAFGDLPMPHRHNFGDKVNIDADFYDHVLGLERRRQTAAANNTAVRDSRLIKMNSNRRPRTFTPGDYVHMAAKSGTKNAPQISGALKVIRRLGVSDYELEEPSTGKRYTRKVFSLVPGRPPDGTPSSTQSESGDDGEVIATTAASIVVDTAGFQLVVARRASADSGHRVFSNTRPKSHRTQQRWIKTKTSAVPMSIISNFDFEVLPGGGLVLPTAAFKQLQQ